ncbi:hypothetical protein ACIBCN_19235 [Nocardia sp. NPDC051052]|uniref:hypothetical protein n=1 Tax=Nocardia sp. NPDC051052 TaxID=3364322 RepID=UPI003793C678
MEGSAGSGRVMQFSEGPVEQIRPDALDVQVEALVERLVEVPPDNVAPFLVQLLWLAEEIQCTGQHLDADSQFGPGGTQARFNARAIVLDMAQPCLDFRLWQGVVYGEVE